MPDRVPETFLRVLEDLARWLEDASIPGMIVGGVAASMLGRPGATRDIDPLVIVAEDDWQEAIATAGNHHIVPRVDDPLAFARRTHVLLLRHQDSGLDIDVIRRTPGSIDGFPGGDKRAGSPILGA